MKPSYARPSVRGKETVVERLTGAVSATLVKARSVTNTYNFFYLDYGMDEVEVYGTQQEAHKGYLKRCSLSRMQAGA